MVLIISACTASDGADPIPSAFPFPFSTLMRMDMTCLNLPINTWAVRMEWINRSQLPVETSFPLVIFGM